MRMSRGATIAVSSLILTCDAGLAAGTAAPAIAETPAVLSQPSGGGCCWGHDGRLSGRNFNFNRDRRSIVINNRLQVSNIARNGQLQHERLQNTADQAARSVSSPSASSASSAAGGGGGGGGGGAGGDTGNNKK